MSGANRKNPWRLRSTDRSRHATRCQNVRGGGGTLIFETRPLLVRPYRNLGDERRGEAGGEEVGRLCCPDGNRVYACIGLGPMKAKLLQHQ